jgi:FtsP/CotA-like multicopper oxidase with cupredoxin domain
MVVNGRTWPVLEVEPRRYRFRLLNGCNSRFLILRLAGDPTTRPAPTVLPFWMIGADGGFLPAPVQLGQILLGPAERADVIVDFTGLAVGTEIYLVNLGTDGPFSTVTEPPEPFADPQTTGQVMKLTVVPPESQDTSVPPDRLSLPAFTSLGQASSTRQVSLNEQTSQVFDGPIAVKLGTLDQNGNPVILGWGDLITENPSFNATEVWEIYNFTQDAHPIHIHEVQFQVVDRQPIGGTARPPEPSESGYKDTVIAHPNEITRVKALFDRAGLFVWHCHIVEHEDNEMMRPYFIGPNPPALTVHMDLVAGKSVGVCFPGFESCWRQDHPCACVRASGYAHSEVGWEHLRSIIERGSLTDTGWASDEQRDLTGWRSSLPQALLVTNLVTDIPLWWRRDRV